MDTSKILFGYIVRDPDGDIESVIKAPSAESAVRRWALSLRDDFNGPYKVEVSRVGDSSAEKRYFDLRQEFVVTELW